jgi:hypothetical protein
VRLNLEVNTFHFVCVGNQFRARGDNESGCHEDSNVGAEGEGGCRMPRYEETEDYTQHPPILQKLAMNFPGKGIQKQ